MGKREWRKWRREKIQKEEMEKRGICQVLQRHEHRDVGRDLEESR
jgi:hypothetical protein